MFKRLFILLYRFISEPAATWRNVSEESDHQNENFYKNYLFPIFGIIALLAFIGGLWAVKAPDWTPLLKNVMKQILVYGGGFFISSYAISEFLFPQVGIAKNRLLSERFTGYASSLLFVVAMFKMLFPSLFFLEWILLYTFYMLWQGGIAFLKIEEEQMVKLTIAAGLIIILPPMLFRWIIELLMPNF
ncbi:MAG: hypothetical protein LBG77_04435 [Dysgonamonadaceae bacterium]|jgi:hypothetical protein|nr:hypothetical protein [Dysgonamonadaceae bacterium]